MRLIPSCIFERVYQKRAICGEGLTCQVVYNCIITRIFKNYQVMYVQIASSMLATLMEKVLSYKNNCDLTMSSYLGEHVVKVLLLSRLTKQIINYYNITFLRLILPSFCKAFEDFYMF